MSLLFLLWSCRAPMPSETDRPAPPTVVDTAAVAEACEGVVEAIDWSFALERFESQGRAPGSMVLTGSSSVRRWEHARRDLASWGPIQRGLGGALLSDLALQAGDIVHPEAESVVVFAGTNDIAIGRSSSEVISAFECFVARVQAQSGPIPVVFVGITPTPARWSEWSSASAVNEAIQQMADVRDDIVYADVPTAFLDLGEPPPGDLFVEDELHLSASGYAVWTEAILDAVQVLPTRGVPAPASAPDGPFYVRVDLGPSNPEDGAPAPEVDGLSIHWNSWHPTDGDAQILAGEVLADLVTTTGEPTGIGLVITGGFRSNGYANGGLTTPDGARLETMALPEATGDFFYTGDPDDPGGLSLFGLEPSAQYTLRLFASRASDELRRTLYTVHGGSEASVSLTTSGPGVGAGGGDGNDSEVAVLTGLTPDGHGELHLDVSIEQGSYAYLSLLELERE